MSPQVDLWRDRLGNYGFTVRLRKVWYTAPSFTGESWRMLRYYYGR